jgi:hypothetical protein
MKLSTVRSLIPLTSRVPQRTSGPRRARNRPVQAAPLGLRGAMVLLPVPGSSPASRRYELGGPVRLRIGRVPDELRQAAAFGTGASSPVVRRSCSARWSRPGSRRRTTPRRRSRSRPGELPCDPEDWEDVTVVQEQVAFTIAEQIQEWPARFLSPT